MKKITTSLLIMFISISVFATDWSTTTLDGAETSRLRAMCEFNSNEAIIAGYDSVLFKTYDGGNTWTKISMQRFYPEGIYGFDFYDASSSGDVSMIAIGREDAAPGFVMKSSDKGDTWSAILVSSFANDSAIDKDPTFDGASGHRFYCIEVVDDNTAFTMLNWVDSTDSKRSGIFKTINGGTSWVYCNTPAITVTSPDGDIEFIGNTGYYAGSSNSYVFKTTDGGETWTDYSNDDEYAFIWGFSLLSEDELFILGQDNLYYYDTPDLSSPTVTALNKIRSYDLLALDKDRVITFHKHDNIWASYTGVISWTNVGNGTLDYVRKCDMVYNDSIYALGNGIIFKAAVNDILPSLATGVDNSSKAITNDINIVNSNTMLYIKSNSNISYVSIFDIAGRPVLEKHFESKAISIATSALKHGIYIVKADKEIKKIIIN